MQSEQEENKMQKTRQKENKKQISMDTVCLLLRVYRILLVCQ